VLCDINKLTVFLCFECEILRMKSHKPIIQPQEYMDRISGRVLLVDDEPALLKMMSVYLGRRGYVVTTSATTEAAWAEVQADSTAFDVAVLDATMAGLSMDELALRMLRANASLCVIAASGYPVDMTAMESAAPGRVIFLHKPFAPEMLAEAVRRMIASQEEDL
jgi:two-component system cell cycle sensor histidine kinase/response regulator CckA